MLNLDRRLLVLVAAVLWLFTPLAAFTQDEDEEEDAPEKMDWLIWESVERFTGQATVQGTGWIDRDDGVQREKVSENSSATLHFELLREPQLYSVGDSRWIAGKVRVSGGETMSSLSDSPTYRLTWSSQAEFDQAVVEDAVNLSLSLNHETGEFQLLLPSRLDTPVPDRIKRSEWRLMGETVNEERTELVYDFVSTIFNGQAAKEIGALSANDVQDYLEEDGRAGHRKTGRVVLVPEYSDFRVVVEFDAHDDKGKKVSYDDWRPFGSIKEPGTPGNYIDVIAVLYPTDGRSVTDLPKVKEFRFELSKTSREPGVAMNWPPKAKDKIPDLRLVGKPESPGLLTGEGQSLVISQPTKDAEGRPAAMTRIDSLDFGGRTELRVVVELEDGRKIIGALQAGGLSYNEIRIPKRDYGEWVADAWRIKNDVEGLPDSDDEENDPVGDGDTGDGLTLYEEYRGFAVRRMKDGRVEGDPKRKDFFILNLIGSDAWQGIHLFEDTTGLRVIHRLEKTEMSEDQRIINGNHTDAPQRTIQHGVVLKTLTPEQMGHSGAQAFDQGALAGFALKPKTTRVVAMPARNDPQSDTNQPWNLQSDDIAAGYDRTVVHELLHSISVAHHGWGDDAAEFRYIPSTYRNNRGGTRQIWTGTAPDMQLVDVRLESTGQRFADMIGPAFDLILDNLSGNFSADMGVAPGTKFSDLSTEWQWSMIQQLPSFYWQIGIETGQHSGNEQCPMRYKFAQIYLAKGQVRTPAGMQATRTKTYYLIPPGSDDIGVTICEAPAGTGINALDRKPQSRFGNAAAMRGNCLAQTCPNDAHLSHMWGLRR